MSIYLSFNLENNFIPCITLPTRITEKSATLIDHIFLRLPLQKIQNRVDAGNLFCSITDHLMNFILIETHTKNNKERPYVRLFTKARIKYYLDNSKNDPPLLPESELVQVTNPNIHTVFSLFMKNLQNSLNKYFPFVRQSRKQFRDKEWITEKLKSDIKKKNELYRKFTEKNTEQRRRKNSPSTFVLCPLHRVSSPIHSILM